MPLSEHEQRLLDQIERQLYAEDPKFAATVRSHDLKTHVTRRMIRFGAVVVLGLGALVAGTILHNVVLGVAGFLVMLAGMLFLARGVQRLGRGDSPANVTRLDRGRRFGRRTRRAPRASDGGTIRERAEERFRRRFEDRDS